MRSKHAHQLCPCHSCFGSHVGAYHAPYLLLTERAANMPASCAPATRVLAHTMSPEVGASRRCTL
eukprot:scaffold27954_cov18-Tisochrysis_lutea.AAC.2